MCTTLRVSSVCLCVSLVWVRVCVFVCVWGGGGCGFGGFAYVYELCIDKLYQFHIQLAR